MKSYNKSDITIHLNNLPGFDVKTANSKGFVDHLLVSKRTGCTIFIEVKLGRDKLSKDQMEYKATLLLAACFNNRLFYYIIDDKNLLAVIAKIIIIENEFIVGGEL